MKKYNVTGMSCAACSARVEKAVKAVDGVVSCNVNLLTNSMFVDGDADESRVIAAVEAAGYGAFSGTGKKKTSSDGDSLEDKETPKLKRRFFISLIFLAVLMYFSMGHMMFGFPIPTFLENDFSSMGLIQLLLTVIIMIINQKFFISGFKGIIHKAPNMDTLVALGAGASFVYSTYALFMVNHSMSVSDAELAAHYMHEFYFESAAMILTLITAGKTLEAYSKGKTTDAIKSLMKLAPETAVIIKDGKEITVNIDEVKKGDIFVVRPGENIPVDGVVTEGMSAVNEAALTGESIPVDKAEGDFVYAASINQSGFIKCEAMKVGEDTTLSQIIKMVSDAAATKAPIAKVADKVSGIFVPAVLIIALITLAVWLLVGESAGFALARGISVLVISCPCALGLATPVAIMVGNGVGARKGILFKTASALEEAGKIKTVVLDKTGTITNGYPVVTDILPYNSSEEELVKYAYSLEIKSEHPLAKAIIKQAEDMNLTADSVENFEAKLGNGLAAVCGGQLLTGGNFKFISQNIKIPEKAAKTADRLANDGKTPLFFGRADNFLGIIAVADTIKEDSPKAVKELQGMGIRVVMLTGDNEKTASAVGKAAGVDEIIAGVLPDGKENAIREFKKYEKTAMVGDGINDAPALTRADIGIAIGAGTDIAIDAADVVLVKSRLSDVSAAIRLSRAVLRNIHQNLFWAFFYNAVGIPLAAGAWIAAFGWKLNPMFGAAAMSLSSFCVVTNALRLNLVDISSAGKDKKIKTKKEKSIMKTLKIEGMMCMHCEARVKKCLEALEEVTSAEVSHESGTATVTLAKELSDEVLISTVEKEGYKVTACN